MELVIAPVCSVIPLVGPKFASVEADVQVSGNLHMFLDLLFRLDCPFQRSLALSLVLASCWWYGARMFAGQNVCLS